MDRTTEVASSGQPLCYVTDTKACRATGQMPNRFCALCYVLPSIGRKVDRDGS